MDEIATDIYQIIAFGKRLVLKQTDEKGAPVTLLCSEEEYNSIWRDYFDMDIDYSVFAGAADPEDAYLSEAVRLGHGIRILRQDIWEMIISFIISQRSNIRRIKKNIDTICHRFGEKCVADDGCEYYSFPTPEALAKADIDELNACALGYRSRYVKKAAEAVYYGDFDIEGLLSMNHAEAKAYLMSLYGVGEKVAECICLFSLHHLDAFPVDTHINQVVSRIYHGSFPFDRYAGFNGVMQQYIFFKEIYTATARIAGPGTGIQSAKAVARPQQDSGANPEHSVK